MPPTAPTTVARRRIGGVRSESYVRRGCASDRGLVVSETGNNVTKIRASDGANLGAFTVAPGPRFVAFDGAHIWVSNQLVQPGLTKTRTSYGAVRATIPVCGLRRAPEGIAFDGRNVWMTMRFNNAVVKM